MSNLFSLPVHQLAEKIRKSELTSIELCTNYIDQIIVDFNKSVIKHLNFSNYSFTENELKNMYRKGDVASHLKNEYHSSIFLKEILNKLEN